MEQEKWKKIAAEKGFWEGFPQDLLNEIGPHFQERVYRSGEYLFHEGESSDCFYVIQGGAVAIQLHTAGKGDLHLETLEKGELVGWSWLFPPHKWCYDGVAETEVNVLIMKADFLREKIRNDLKWEAMILRRFSHIMVKRLQAARMQMLDIYQNCNEGMTGV